jgi:hypothetical protein
MESIDSLNRRLIEYFGVDTITGDPIWRIVFSDDQYEKRLIDVIDEGFPLLIPEVREVPKYKQWIQHKYVLERLVVVPKINAKELPGAKLTYEPLWVYEDKDHNPLAPKWEVTEFVIDTVYSAQGKSNLAKYKPDEKDLNTKESAELRIKELEKELFGNETDVGDSLAHDQAIIVPRNYGDN